MSNLLQRVIFGLLGACLLIFLVWYGYLTFTILVVVLSLLAFDEIYGLLGGRRDLAYLIGQMINAGILVLISFETAVPKTQLFLVTFSVSFVIPLIKLFQKRDNIIMEWLAIIFGLAYVMAPFSLFLIISGMGEKYEYMIPLGILFLIWANDTGAYFAGKFLGRHKLFERISPKKTWEGSVGGLILSLITACLLGIYFDIFEMKIWFGIAIITTVFGAFGDLVESMIKRNLDIKDSGKLIPGHGGILDRFDALILAIPFIYIFLHFAKFLSN